MKWLRRKITNWLIHHTFCGVAFDDVITIDERMGVVIIDGKVLTKMQLENLKREAIELSHMTIFKILTSTPLEKAHTLTFKNATDYEMTLSGKLMYYIIDLQRNIVSKLSTGFDKK